MVGINDLLGLSLLVIASSTILKPGRNIPYSYNLSQSPITENFYKTRQNINFQAIKNITSAQDKLQDIRSQTLQQEKFKTEAKINILESEKNKAGALLSQLQKFVQLGYKQESYSPRLRRKFGNLTPEVEATIQRGKQALEFIPGIKNIINTLDQNILKLNKSYSSLESI
jgi:hypothetical protein